MSVDIDVAVIGAGVVGLAAAGEIAAAGRTVCLIEKHPRPGMETSTHNSGVIHAGIYYPANTLKARLCVEGAERMYAFCASHGVPHERCGKLIVAAAEEEMPELERLYAVGAANGVQGLQIVDAAFVRAREPRVRGAVAALWSPNTGRLDQSLLVLALRRVAEDAGVMLVPGTTVIGGDQIPEGYRLRLSQEEVSARVVVNAAGLYADDVSTMLGGESFKIWPCRGEYAVLKPALRNYVNGLVYPLPHASGAGLGVHLTKAPDGTILLGPTIGYQDSKDDYETGRIPLEDFVAPAQRLLPDITIDDLRLGDAGIRAKLHGPAEKFADFLIRPDRQAPALLHAAGIDSPGLTSSLAIGKMVAEMCTARV